MLLEKINKLCAKDEVLIVDGDYCYIVVQKTDRLRSAYIRTNGEWKQIDLPKIIEKIAEYFKDKVDVKTLLKEVMLLHSHPDQIKELDERVDKEAKVTEQPRCYSLMVGGKRGRPHEFTLVC